MAPTDRYQMNAVGCPAVDHAVGQGKVQIPRLPFFHLDTLSLQIELNIRVGNYWNVDARLAIFKGECMVAMFPYHGPGVQPHKPCRIDRAVKAAQHFGKVGAAF